MLSHEDPRFKIIALWIRHYFCDNEKVENLVQLASQSAEAENFVNDANTIALEIYENENNEFIFSNTISCPPSCKNQVYFVKSRPISLSKEDMKHTVKIGSISSPTQGLLQEIKNVYGPLLIGNSYWSQQLNPIAQNLISQLESALQNSLQARPVSTTFFSVEEETKYWSSQSAKNHNAAQIDEIFSRKSIAKEFMTLEQKSLLEVTQSDEPLIEKVKDTLEDLWLEPEEPYPQSRMQQLIAVISGSITKYIQLKLSQVNIWKEKYSVVKRSLDPAIEMCYEWIKCIRYLFEKVFTSSQRKWKGPKFEEKLVQPLLRRLEEILFIRNSFEQITLNFTKEEASQLKLDTVLDMFLNLQAVQVNSYTEQFWKAALTKFEEAIMPIEKRICERLKAKLNQFVSKPRVLLLEFEKNKEIVMRPSLFKFLVDERSALLGQLKSEINAVRADFENMQFENKSDQSSDVGKFMTNLVHCIECIYQMKDRLHAIIESAKDFVHDFPESAKIKLDTDQLHQDLQDYSSTLFVSWMKEIEKQMEQNRAEFEIKGSMISMDSNKKLVVNYSPRIVSLIKEVRQLRALKFEIPDHVLKLTEVAQQVYAHAVSLKQVANYYNTVHSQIISSQAPMLIDAASSFENVIFSLEKQQQSWQKNTSDQFVSKLRSAADKFTSENRKLRKYHSLITDKVTQLISIDLLKEKEKWLEKIREIKTIFKQVEQQGYGNMETWKIHWDFQLYKAFEFQYVQGLELLNENVEEIKVSLVFKERTLQYNPSLEKIKEKYFDKLREFLAFPTVFKGVSNSNIFEIMPQQNSKDVQMVYKKSFALFSRLQKLIKKCSEYVILGTVDLEQLIEQSLTEVVHWEANFIMLKEKGKEVEKMDSSVKVDCVVVSLENMKSTIEDQLQRFSDLLAKSLRKSAQQHLLKIDNFIIISKEKLTKGAVTREDIGKAHLLCKKLMEEKSTIYAELEEFEKKNRLLKSVTGISLEKGTTLDKWNEFEETIQGHQAFLEERTTALKGELEGKILAFKNDVAKFATRWHELKPKNLAFTTDEQASKDIQFIKERREELEEFKRRSAELLQECEYYDIKFPSISDIDETSDDIQRFSGIWKIYEDFNSSLQLISSEEWLTFKKKMFAFEDFISDWMDKLKRLDKNSITLQVRDRLDNYVQTKDIFKYITGDGWTVDHWSSLFKMLGMDIKTSVESLKLGDFISRCKNLQDNFNNIKELNARAMGEDQIRKALQELKIWESSTEFAMFEQNNKNTKIALIKEWKDILTEVGDNQNLVQSLKDTHYADLFTEEIAAWTMKLSNLSDSLQHLNIIQRKWLYLEPIFARGALPMEQPRFLRVDKDFRTIMGEIDADKRVMSLSKRNLNDKLVVMIEQLEICQKALNQFLEDKRSAFPRFYFIGDDDLLEILGQAQNPNIIQSHLKKLFAGINSVIFNESSTSIVAICSADGEVVQLQNSVVISEKVEEWLSRLDKEMNDTLAKLLFMCDESPDFDIAAFPEQILCLSANINFARKCEAAITAKTLQNLDKELKEQLELYTSIDTKDNKVIELRIKALVLDLIHNRDVVHQLIAANVTKIDDWVWQKQLRFTIEQGSSGKVCYAKMCNANFLYTYEYQGNVSKLVHTPLTDKCYLTLTQGMHLGYGGNPYGPAGTGKTESVKALGNLLGRQVLVFNCDEGIDFKSMGRILIGIVKCGAWGCFDEFNRLKEDQLSAISQQIQLIQAAIKDKRQTPIELLGKQVSVNFNSGIFVTLNPAGKGYGGRSKLPDNLKQLFRAVAMAVPDNELISETIMYSEGFEHAKYLGRKLVSIFTLCKQLLSRQQHYDWGLRSLKAVLKVGGDLIKRERRLARESSNYSISKEIESQIVIKALRVNTVSKLTFEDNRLFDGIIADVFPAIKASDIAYEELETAIIEVMKEQNLKIINSFVKKILQFYEAVKQRMGVVLVGPSGSGKTTVWKVLSTAISRLGTQVKTYVANPKAMPRQQLLGHMDNDTREWFDGILTANSRKVVKENASTMSWIVSDGDIDPEWIESLNSVLDDNHLLTMPNGERIQFGSNVNFIFETHSLKYASPATVSRMGMLFLSEEDIQVSDYIDMWLLSQPESIQTMLRPNIEKLFIPSLHKLLQFSDLAVETSAMGIVKSGLSQVRDSKTKAEFICGIIKGIGSYLPVESRTLFAKDVFVIAGEDKKIDIKRPLDYYSNENGTYGVYQLVQSNDMTIEKLKNSPVIQTVDVQRCIDIVYPWIERMEPVILIGPEGCGKSMCLQYCFSLLNSVTVATIHCNSQTQASNIIQVLHQNCAVFSSNLGKVLRPKETERLVLFLKDINLPKPDMYGTTQLISFLQQLVSYNGFYDKELEWVSLERIQIVCSMNPSNTVGRHKVSSRFSSIVRICCLATPKKEQLQTVYAVFLQVIFKHYFSSHPVWVNPKNAIALASVLVEFFEKLSQKFTVDDQPHYQLTPRDLTSWIVGLLNYKYNNSPESSEVIQVLLYEARRIFRDRLVNQHQYYDGLEDSVMLKGFEAFNYIAPPKDGPPIIYSSLLQDKDRKLCLIPFKDFGTLVTNGLKSYQREFRKLRLFVVAETAQLIAFVERVLVREGSSLLFVGRPGIGRSMITSLVSHMLKMQLFTLRMTQDYSIKSFKVDLKYVLSTTGVNNDPLCFLVEDYNMIDPRFLEYLNSLLSSGEVPGLYTPEELEQILLPLKEKASQEGFYGSLYSYFTQRVQKNLRIIFVFDPTNPEFRARCQSNPAIITKCSIQWVENWSERAYLRIPQFVLQDILNSTQYAKKQDEFLKLMIKIHQAFDGKQATPLHFVRFIDTFKKLFETKRKTKQEQLGHLLKGLAKINETATAITKLSQNAEEQKKLLAEKQAQARAAMEEIKKSMELSFIEQSDITKLSAQISVEEAKLKEKEAEVNSKLAKILPTLEAAKNAVGLLEKRNLDEIKAFAIPPPAVKDVLEGVLRLMGSPDTSWKGMKKFLSTTGVREQIMNFNARDIKSNIVKAVKDHVQANANSFEDEVIFHSCQAAAPLAKWLKANILYSEVIQQVGPLEQEVGRLRSVAQQYQTKLEQCKQKLQSLNQKSKELEMEYEKRTSEVQQLRVDVEKADKTLTAAQNLLGKLSGEKERWDKQAKEEQSIMNSLPLYILGAAAFITYLGGHPEDVRRNYVESWKTLLNVPDFDFLKLTSAESDLLKYKAEGLPSDELSKENAVTILECVQYPLLIDPAQQATEWLKNHLKEKTLEFTNPRDEKFMNNVELAIRFGKTLIIQEVDGVEPILYPLLRNEIVSQGTRKVVTIGDKPVDYSDDFRLFMITRNPNIVLSPDAVPLVTEVNFSVTRSGLESQLLGKTIQHENPDLEIKKSELLKQEEDGKMQLAELEKQLLNELATSKGNLLENDALVQRLNEIKQKSQSVMSNLQDATKLKAELDTKREAYRAFAKSGSNLFFLIMDLKQVNHMYQMSLNSFLLLFDQALNAKIDKAANVEARIALLQQKLQTIVFKYISRSLFKQDRLLFGLHIVKGLFDQMFVDNEWLAFLGKLPNTFTVDVPKWVPSDRIDATKLLLSSSSDIAQKLELHTENIWTKWMKSSNCEADFPSSIAKRLTNFERVLVMRALRPDQAYNAMNIFVKNALGLTSTSSLSLNLEKVYTKETNCKQPILLLTTPGADPSQELEELANKIVGSSKFIQIAMGQGQTDAAIHAIRKGAKNGDWVCLKNLHLVVTWVSTLEKELSMLNPHANFRLWLTSEPTDSFPDILLQQSLKITFEAPPGVKQNLLRTYDSWNQGTVSKGSKTRAQLLFVLAWFHAIVQERRSYIPLGWTKFYEFSTADLRSACDIIDSCCNGQNADWTTIHGLLENAIYGGRLDNPFDLRILRAYLHKFFNPSIVDTSTPVYQKDALMNGIVLPATNQHSDYMQLIQNLSDVNSPEMFTLPLNADKLVQIAQTEKIIEKLKMIHSAVDAVGKFDREKWASVLIPILQFWKRLTSNHAKTLFSTTNAFANIDRSKKNPVEGFVLLEYQNALSLVQFVEQTLNNISEVMKGAVLLTPDIQKDAFSLLKGIVPQRWLDKWEGPEDVHIWMTLVVEKTISLLSWCDHAEKGTLLHQELAWKNLFNPDVFLNALKQHTARENKIPLDDLTQLCCSWNVSAAKSKCSVTMKGWYLQGCGFDGENLTEVSASADAVIEVPSMILQWIVREPAKKNEILVPVYFSLSRERLLAEVGMTFNSNTQTAKWILSGVALFSNNFQ